MENNGGGVILYNVGQILFLPGIYLHFAALGEFLAKDLKHSLSFLYLGS